MPKRGAQLTEVQTARRPTARQADPIDRKIGAKVSQRRKQLGITMARLAAAAGIAINQMYKYEHGMNRIAPARISRIAEVLDVPIHWFFEHETEAQPLQQQAQQLLVAFRAISDLGDREKVLRLAERLAKRKSGA